MGIRYDFDAGDTPVKVFESICGDYVYYDDYQDLEVKLTEYKDELSLVNDKYDALVRDIRALYMENK